MLTLCSLLAPIFDALQQVLNLAWFPLSIFGTPVPSASQFFGGVFGCSV